MPKSRRRPAAAAKRAAQRRSRIGLASREDAEIQLTMPDGRTDFTPEEWLAAVSGRLDAEFGQPALRLPPPP